MSIASRIKNRFRGNADQQVPAEPDERGNYPGAVAVDEPNRATLDFLRATNCRMIAEVGIYRGHTSREIATWLEGEGELHLYDFYDVTERVAGELRSAGHDNIREFPNSYKYLDSYNWSLAKTYEANPEPIYDYVFIDGAHTFAIDALATVLADRLLKPGGYIDFDDYVWTLGGSPSLRPELFELTGQMYTREQIDTKQVKMIVDLLIRRDGRYEEVVPDKIYQKVRA